MMPAGGVPRMPYGMAKRIVGMMRVGDVVNVRPPWVGPMHNAARRMGVRLASVSTRRDGALMFRMVRIEAGWRSGHLFARLPRRNPTTGHWLKGESVERRSR